MVTPVNAALVPMPEKAAVTELGVKENPLKPLKVVLVSLWKGKKAVEPGRTRQNGRNQGERYLSAGVPAFGLLNGAALQHGVAGDGKGSGLAGDDRLRLTRFDLGLSGSHSRGEGHRLVRGSGSDSPPLPPPPDPSSGPSALYRRSSSPSLLLGKYQKITKTQQIKNPHSTKPPRTFLSNTHSWST